MAKINLRDLYPEYELNCYVEVTDGDEGAFIAAMTKEVADVYVDFKRAENAYKRRTYRYKAHFSLDRGDGIENDAIHHAPSPEDIFMEKLTRDELSAAISGLTETQRRRITAYIVHEMSYQAIAEAEGVDESSVRESIRYGFHNMEKHLKNIF